MKRSNLLLAALAVIIAGVNCASAQDAAAPIRRPSPTPVEESSAAQPTVTPSSAAQPSESSATPAASATSPAPGPAAAAKRAERASTPARPRSAIEQTPVRPAVTRPAGRHPKSETAVPPAPPLQPGSRPTFDLSGEGGGYIAATVRALENKWQTALMKHDIKTIDQLVADDFVATSVTGKLGSKSTLLYQLGRDRNVYHSATTHGMMVRAHGGKVAVVTGIAKESGTTADGKRFTNSRRFTDTWMERNGRWQCIASQVTQLPGR